jgi:hypothetical protein
LLFGRLRSWGRGVYHLLKGVYTVHHPNDLA